MKTILILALSRSPWIGGIYYRKNIIHMMLTNETIKANYRILVLTNETYLDVFQVFGTDIDIVTCKNAKNLFEVLLKLMKCYFGHKIKYIFPVKPYALFKLLGITPVSWIADFQHNHYPEFFDEDEIQKRNKDFGMMADAKNPLVLSSNSALQDFRTFYSKERENVHVVHFTSYIQDEVCELTDDDEFKVLEKYELKEQPYVIVCNQFWKHKNHIVVFKAIKQLVKECENLNVKFVFTGEPSDRRNPEYFNELLSYIKDGEIADYIRLLGFVERKEQLCLMKHATVLVQPSLFEGWGTVVEDSKVLGTKMIVSDIPVHAEQMNAQCVMFRANSCEDLAQKILEELQGNRAVFAQEDMTCEYGKALGKIFCN